MHDQIHISQNLEHTSGGHVYQWHSILYTRAKACSTAKPIVDLEQHWRFMRWRWHTCAALFDKCQAGDVWLRERRFSFQMSMPCFGTPRGRHVKRTIEEVSASNASINAVMACRPSHRKLCELAFSVLEFSVLE